MPYPAALPPYNTAAYQVDGQNAIAELFAKTHEQPDEDLVTPFVSGENLHHLVLNDRIIELNALAAMLMDVVTAESDRAFNSEQTMSSILTGHISDTSDPHGTTLTQTNLNLTTLRGPDGVAGGTGPVVDDNLQIGDEDLTLEIKSVTLDTSNRSMAMTRDGNGRLSTVVEKDGLITIKTSTFTYDAQDRITTAVYTANGKTATHTYTYNLDGSVDVTKVVT